MNAVRAAGAIAVVYGYFLLFAQFSFVELLRSAGGSLLFEKVALGGMALMGIVFGFVAAWRNWSVRSARFGLGIAAFAAALSSQTSNAGALLFAALLTGGSLGVITVTLASHVRGWCHLPWLGVGTGLAYAACNVPWVFLLPPENQALVAAGWACLGVFILPRAQEVNLIEKRLVPFSFIGMLVLFTALVWMDSAAFFVIQHTVEFKSGTWGETDLWRNAIVHLTSALLAGRWLANRGQCWVLGLAWLLLAIASVAVNHSSTRFIAAWLYPAGVSFYSTALIAWPAWFRDSISRKAVAWQAAWLFAVAGWFGSANGIGMAQTLQQVPTLFVMLSGCAVVSVLLFSLGRRVPACASLVGVILLGYLGHYGVSPATSLTQIERGRQVYLAEGCIHCHSQYVRPNSPDEDRWGPASSKIVALQQSPVLIGNRRQGPDLANIGARRSAAWLREHFQAPSAFSKSSPMPNYSHLFENDRGEALVAYLSSLGRPSTQIVHNAYHSWQLPAIQHPPAGDGLFAAHCAVCHGATGLGDGSLARHFVKSPTNLSSGPFLWTVAGPALEDRVARAVKFGIPGTDMPGHEVLSDEEVAALTHFVLQLRRNSKPLEPTPTYDK